MPLADPAFRIRELERILQGVRGCCLWHCDACKEQIDKVLKK